MNKSFPLHNIEDDFSTLHQLEKDEYLITDPRLISGMVLSENIKSRQAAHFATIGTRLTPTILEKLQELGVERVHAKFEVEETIEEAAEEMGTVFDNARNTIFREGIRTAMDAIEHLKKGGRIELDPFRDGVMTTVEQIVSQYSEYAAEGVRELERHDQNTTLHSVEVSLMCVGLAKELGWSRDRTIRAGLCGMVHDVGKAGVSLEVLKFPGRLNEEQWEEMQRHALIGYLILSNNERVVDVPAFCAGAHHESYTGQGRTYGITGNPEVQRDIPAYYNDEDRQLAQLVAIADVNSALGEARDYKTRKLPIEIAIIMNLEARHGKFNPRFYRVWYEMYTRKYPLLLQKGYCFPLPSAKRQELFRREDETRVILPMSEKRLYYEELEKLDLVERLASAGLRKSDLKRRNGITLHELHARKIDGIPYTFGQFGIEVDKPIKYNLVAVDVQESARAKFLIMKDYDTLKDIQHAIAAGRLDPVQQHLLLNRNIELDFSQEVACPV